MEGEGEGSHAWKSIEGEGEGSLLSGQWKVKTKSFSPLLTSPPQPILLKPSIFPFDLKVLLYHGSRPLFMCFLPSLYI
jgi:hypothetical protein